MLSEDDPIELGVTSPHMLCSQQDDWWSLPSNFQSEDNQELLFH
jgi:hypothetical protein